MNLISSFTSQRVATIFMLYFFLFGHTLLLAQSASDSSRSQHTEQENKCNNAPPGAKELRLSEFFIIGEKAVGFESRNKNLEKKLKIKKGEIFEGIRQVENFGIINAYSILDVKLRANDWIIPLLEKKKYNILIIAELKKKGEDTWNRISVVNRYTWEIKKSSLAEEEEERKKEEAERKKEEENKKSKEGKADSNETSNSKRIKPFYIIDEILFDNPFLRVGDKVVALFFYDIKRPTTIYLDDLKKAQQRGQSFITIDAQKIYLVTSGSAPQEYSAKDGDEIRLRFLRAEYSIKRQKEVEDLLKKIKEPPPPAKYGDIVNVEDEMHFIFKKFGIKLSVSPTIVYGSQVANGLNSEEFNPISKNPSLGSNIYLIYDGRSPNLKILNYIPGIHLSLLGLTDSGEENGPNEAQFTFGFVWSVIPSLRNYFGFFYGWHNLKDPVFGVTFSPNIDFRALVSADKGNK